LQRIVTIDGPVAAGKSSVARCVAERVGFRYLDTGALYRAVALAAMESGTDLEDGAALGALAAGLDLAFDREGRTLLGGRDVSREIRGREVTRHASPVSAHAEVRAAMLSLQRQMAGDDGLVCEGRDMGTVVFPDAAVKIYLDADVATRAARRASQLRASGAPVDIEELEREIRERDHRDSNRATAPLVRDETQVYVDSSNLELEEVVSRLETLVRERIPVEEGTDA